MNVPTKNNGADSLELYLFKEQCPSSEHIKSSLRSECPPDKKVKLDNLFEFRRKRGDFVFSVIFLVVALFFWAHFSLKQVGIIGNCPVILAHIFCIS